MVHRLFPRRALPWWKGIPLAVGASLCAWLLRYALEPLLGGEMPYTMFFLAVLVASTFGAWKAGIAASLLGGILANFSFVSGSRGLIFDGDRGWAFGVFLVVSLVLVSLVHALASTLRRETELLEELTTVSGEYRHRIKNLIAVAQSLVHQSARGSSSVEELRDKALDRLHALGRVQDLLDAGKALALPLHTLVDETLKPYGVSDRLARPISGPQVLVPADTTIAMALLLNELATNATKYGALSVDGGRLQIGWVPDGDCISIEWRETGGPAVTRPTRLGFGSRLVASALPSGKGSARLLFEPEGLRCVIRLRTASDETPPAAHAARRRPDRAGVSRAPQPAETGADS